MEDAVPPSPNAGLESPNSIAARSRADSDAPDNIQPPVQASSRETERKNIIREMLETERKYVGDLEIMSVRPRLRPRVRLVPAFAHAPTQQFATQLGQRGVMDADTLHHMFPNLPALLDFQQRFLIRMEQTAELPWTSQQWGRVFSENVRLRFNLFPEPRLPAANSDFDPYSFIYRRMAFRPTSPTVPTTLVRPISSSTKALRSM